MAREPSRRGGGVDALTQRPHVDLAVAQLDHKFHQVADRSAEAIESSHDQNVAGAGVGELTFRRQSFDIEHPPDTQHRHYHIVTVLA
jgi:hypothetical protein